MQATHSVVLALEFPDPNRHDVIELLFCDFFGICAGKIEAREKNNPWPVAFSLKIGARH